MSYVSDTVQSVIQLRNTCFGQSVVLQQILLDAIDERF